MRPLDRLSSAAHSVGVLARAGVLHVDRPDRLVRMAAAARHWGPNLAAAFAVGAARYGDRVALIDERGTLTFNELDERTDALARALQRRGVQPGDTVAILCRNHRYFFDATGALSKLGVHAVFLNTGFSAPQLRDVMARERASLLIHDEEYAPIADEAGITDRIVAFSAHGDAEVDALIEANQHGERLARPTIEARTIILTSGTTGTPKGAVPARSSNPAVGVALLDRIPYRARETMVVAAPTFHSWGFSNSFVSILLGDTMVLQRHFNPERVIEALAHNRAQVLAAVPVMLIRMLEVDDDVRRQYDTSALRLVPLSGSALPGDLAPRFMKSFGPVIYNLYGSTEAGAVTIANPEDLMRAPSTAGRPPRGIDVRLLGDSGRDVAVGDTGRIFVRSPMTFSGYTDGQSKNVVDGFMQTGDTGHFDTAGLLFVDGRDDDMIISGGENVFPSEVEDVIASHPDVSEVAVIGVADDEFGQRLKAFVVPAPGHSLDADTVRDLVRATLARYKVPREVEFVDALPRNATGKVVRRNLD
ncbi:MAG TPA: AMP-binding protein [Acidimicrobiia bacterium]|nr:AMP-binding protein [Acidimicrobiia bacterium]